MNKLSVFSDEVSQDLDIAIEFAKKYDLDGVELRSVYDKGPFDWTADDAKLIAKKLKDNSLEVCCLSLPFYKCEIDSPEERAAHLNGLKKSLEYADLLGCRLVRGFDFWRHDSAGEPPMDEIVSAYGPVVDMLKGTGITLAMEIEPSTWAANVKMTRDVIAAIGAPEVRALWDGANLLWSETGEVPAAGYEIIKDMVVHVHIKDGVRAGGKTEAVKIGTGESDVSAQLKLLKRDGYAGWFSLETHYRLSRELSEEALKLPSGHAFSEGGYAASAESMESLKAIIAAL